MLIEEMDHIKVEQVAIASRFLKRQVIVDLYIPKSLSDTTHLLLINDGQDLPEMPFDKLLNGLIGSNQVQSLLCAAVYAGKDRRNEYGTAAKLDYAGRGAKAALYEQFVLKELLPFVHTHCGIEKFATTSFAGFSLGGLTAIDVTWHHPEIFCKAGVFSGSLW